MGVGGWVGESGLTILLDHTSHPYSPTHPPTHPPSIPNSNRAGTRMRTRTWSIPVISSTACQTRWRGPWIALPSSSSPLSLRRAPRPAKCKRWTGKNETLFFHPPSYLPLYSSSIKPQSAPLPTHPPTHLPQNTHTARTTRTCKTTPGGCTKSTAPGKNPPTHPPIPCLQLTSFQPPAPPLPTHSPTP